MKKTTRPIIPVPASPMTTSRLLLRPLQQSDLAEYHILRTQIEVMKWTTTGKVDADLEATQVWLNRFLAPNDATTFNFAVEELGAPGKAVGVVGCHILEPPECGYMLKKEVWGKGYATEALKRFLQAWWELPRNEVELDEKEPKVEDKNAVKVVPEVLNADIVDTNYASARILEKCGFKRVSEELIEEKGEMITLVRLELERPQ